MASLLCSSHSLPRTNCFTHQRPKRVATPLRPAGGVHHAATSLAAVAKHTVEILHLGETHTLTVKENETVLEVALEKGLELPHDCKLGVCMTCPAMLTSGKVDTGGSMLSEDVAAQGYTLMCQASPRSDCKIRTIEEDELLDLQMGSQ